MLVSNVQIRNIQNLSNRGSIDPRALVQLRLTVFQSPGLSRSPNAWLAGRRLRVRLLVRPGPGPGAVHYSTVLATTTVVESPLIQCSSLWPRAWISRITYHTTAITIVRLAFIMASIGGGNQKHKSIDRVPMQSSTRVS